MLSYRGYTTLLSYGLECIIHTLLGIILPSYLYFTILDCWLAISKGNMYIVAYIIGSYSLGVRLGGTRLFVQN